MDFTYNDYISDILSGKISACKKVKLAVKRHVEDLKKADAGAFPYIFDHEKAQKAILFFCQLVHTEGELAGQKLKPEPWRTMQIFMILQSEYRKKINEDMKK